MKKRNVLLSSILVIALCLSVIVGSTFALFTDKTEFDISVTSGDVEILATADVNSIYSAVKTDDSTLSDEFLKDEYGKYYTHEEQTDTFLNGGTAEVVNGVVVIKRITPGDRVDIDINVANTSDVAISYRYKIVSNNTNLATGMAVTTFNKDGSTTATEALAIWTSDWYAAVAPGGTPEAIPTRTISIELPVYAGNEYQSEAVDQDDGRVAGVQSVEYTVIVEAVQGNASTENEEEFVVYQTEKVANVPLADGSDYIDPAGNVALVKDLYLVGDANAIVDQNAVFVMDNVTADVNGSVIILDDYNPAILIMNCDFTLDAGEYIVDASQFGTAYQIFLVNVTVNGEALPYGQNNAVAAQYLNNVGWFEVVDPMYW